MEFIIIENYNTRNHYLETDSQGFVETFPSYEDAEAHALENELRDYAIFSFVPKSRN